MKVSLKDLIRSTGEPKQFFKNLVSLGILSASQAKAAFHATLPKEDPKYMSLSRGIKQFMPDKNPVIGRNAFGTPGVKLMGFLLTGEVPEGGRAVAEVEEVAVPAKRGRPLGSKNKVKAEATAKRGRPKGSKNSPDAAKPGRPKSAAAAKVEMDRAIRVEARRKLKLPVRGRLTAEQAKELKHKVAEIRRDMKAKAQSAKASKAQKAAPVAKATPAPAPAPATAPVAKAPEAPKRSHQKKAPVAVAPEAKPVETKPVEPKVTPPVENKVEEAPKTENNTQPVAAPANA